MSEQPASAQDPTPETAPEKPEMLCQTGPLPPGTATVEWPSLSRPRPGRLVLSCPLWFHAPLLLILVLYAAALGLGLNGRLLWQAWRVRDAITVIAIATPLTLFFGYNWVKYYFLPRLTFDRGQGQLRIGLFGRRGSRPLAEVAGVQLQQVRNESVLPGGGVLGHTSYQVNLLLEGKQERLNLMSNPRLYQWRDIGTQLAEFLEVPLHDLIPGSAGPVQVGAQGMAVEQTLLPRGWATIPYPVLRRPGPDCLLIRPGWLGLVYEFRFLKMALFGFVLLGVVLLFLIIGLIFGMWLWPGRVWVFYLLPFLLIEVTLAFFITRSLFCSRARFDRNMGILALGWFGRWGKRPLPEIIAIQYLRGTEYQLNLVLADPREPRLNLILSNDAEQTRQVAVDLAAFLEIDLLELPVAAPEEATDLAARAEKGLLPPGKATVSSPTVVCQKGQTTLIIRPAFRDNASGKVFSLESLLGFVVLSLVLLLLSVHGPVPQDAKTAKNITKGLGMLGSLLLVFGSLYLAPQVLRRVCFDRKRGPVAPGMVWLQGATLAEPDRGPATDSRCHEERYPEQATFLLWYSPHGAYLPAQPGPERPAR